MKMYLLVIGLGMLGMSYSKKENSYQNDIKTMKHHYSHIQTSIGSVLPLLGALTS